MQIEHTELPGVRIISLDVHRDERGVFAESYDRAAFEVFGVGEEFVHDSFSTSHRKGTVRGLHFQRPPRSQSKLVRVTRGEVFDVVVDLRASGPSFGAHVSLLLSEDDPKVVYVPHGFAHGFCTMTDDTEITYKMSDHFSTKHYSGVLWSDPALGIEWPVAEGDAIVSEMDLSHATLAEAGLAGLDWSAGGAW